MPYQNQYDALANDFSDIFTATLDFRPYNAVSVDTRIFDTKKVLKPLDEKFDWEGVKNSPLTDTVKDIQTDQKEKNE